MRMVLRISLGMTTLPRSSMRRTIPVAFILSNLSVEWMKRTLNLLFDIEEWLYWKIFDSLMVLKLAVQNVQNSSSSGIRFSSKK